MTQLTEAIAITALFKVNRYHKYCANDEASRQAFLVLDYRPMIAGLRQFERAQDFYHVCADCQFLA